MLFIFSPSLKSFAGGKEEQREQVKLLA